MAGCAADREAEPLRLSQRYFAANNTAAREGPDAQRDFFRRTQHPDFPAQECDLGGSTVEFDPAWSTLRRDPQFTSDGIEPRGAVWVVGVEVTTRRDGVVQSRQIGSQHLVMLNGSLYGFAPCAR
ncbi:hypothetical protein [Salinifilum aidingensis]